ncbi:MAG TPA: hypothetical protein VLR94_06690 [Acidobacteriota bacterium]|nr:hypothetical protein [Acidobacteriota bacterium]
MILFLTKSFQLRLRLAWKPDLRAFLVGDRNLFFYVPEVIIETPDISPASIDAFLKRGALGGSWQLLGLMSPEEQPPLPGYAQVCTSGRGEPLQWDAKVHLLSGETTEARMLEIRLSN